MRAYSHGLRGGAKKQKMATVKTGGTRYVCGREKALATKAGRQGMKFQT